MTHFRNGWWVAALVALSACNPWSDTKGGAPAVLSAFVAGGNGSDGGTNSVEGERSGAGTEADPYVWTIPGTTTCGTVDPDDEDPDAPFGQLTVANEFVVWVKLNKLIDGASIEQEPNTCVPAGVEAGNPDGGWFTVTQVSGTTPVGTVAEETSHWYSCYYPATSTTNEGASILFYRTGGARDYTTNPETVPGTLASGQSFWDLACDPSESLGTCKQPLPVRNNDVTTYTISGVAADKSGTPLPITVVFQSLPDSGAADLGVTAVTGNVDQASSVTLEWTEGECGTASKYVLQRKNTDGSWADIATEPLGGTTSFTDDTVTYGSAYDYRIVEVIHGAETTTDFTQVKATKTATILLIPAAPTVVAGTPPQNAAAVTWTSVPGAENYTVERAIEIDLDPSPAVLLGPADFIAVGTVSATATLALPDGGLDPQTGYYYRVVANNANGSSEPSAPTRIQTAAP